MINKVLLFTLTIAAVSAVNYEGYRVYKVIPKNEEQVNIIENLRENGVGEVWEEFVGVNKPANIMVGPEKQKVFKDVTNKAGIESRVLIRDVKRAINDQMRPADMTRSGISHNESHHLSMDWIVYQNLDSIYAYLDELAESYPDIVSTEIMGQSVENRDIKGIIINYNRDRNVTRFGMIEGTLHAREWISTSTVTWIIKEFLTSTDPEVRALAENFEWHIFPIINPDGYVYTFTTNRMWRKNRSTASFKICATADDDMSNGVDLNRNFDFQWMSVGASNDSCTNTYAGPSPLSEPESAALASYVSNLNNRGEIIYYIAFHSYSQLIIIPYSHLTSVEDEGLPENYDDMLQIARAGAEGMRQRFNTAYRVGLSADELYPMSGTSFDWVKYHTNVPVCYLIELRDRGFFREFGFLLPSEQIIPSGLETMDAFIAMDRKTRELGIYEIKSSAVNIDNSVFMLILGVIVSKAW